MGHWGNTEINDKGHLVLGGCDAVKLAEQFSTPLYVMEESKIRNVCKSYMRAVQSYSGGGKVLYASKAFTNTAMCKIVQSEGLGLDVASAGELHVALNAGFDTGSIYMHGNNKTADDLRMAVKAKIGRIVIDSLDEIDLISEAARQEGRIQDVSVRIKPGIEAHTHDYIKTGQIDSKFGLGICDGQAQRAVKSIIAQKNLNLVGVHSHIGSQIFELSPFRDAAAILVRFIKRIKEDLGYELTEINLGGGFGIHYTKNDKPLMPQDYVSAIVDELETICSKNAIKPPSLVIEPGRSIAGEAGTTLYTIGTIKHIEGVRTYVSIDGGMADNIRPALYNAKYSCALANRMREPENCVVTIAGRACESGDMLIWDAALPKVNGGDVLAVFSTGAYNYSMASNYNKLPHPSVVLVNNARAELMVRRQSFDDLIRNDVIPSWL